MINLKEDITQLVTVDHYAKMTDVNRQTVYNMIKDGRLKGVIIDGVRFVKLKKDK